MTGKQTVPICTHTGHSTGASVSGRESFVQCTNIRTNLLLNLIPNSPSYLFALWCIIVCCVFCQIEAEDLYLPINEVNFPRYLSYHTLTWKWRTCTYTWVSPMMLVLISWWIHKRYKCLQSKIGFYLTSGCGKTLNHAKHCKLQRHSNTQLQLQTETLRQWDYDFK